MASVGTAFLDVKPDLSSFNREMGSSRFSSVGKKAGLALAAGVGVGLVALGKVVKDSLGAAQEAVELEAQTAAVIKSTGGAAKVSLKEIDNLSTRIMGYSAISDEAVRGAANMLLTFKNVRDEAGKGNDIFTQATESIVDMSVALGKDLNSSTIMVGKALNDPIAGIAAMGRAGVQFTDEQKEMITTLVESGKTMDAQKLILKELESQFGGSAKAVGDTKPWDKFKNSLGEVQESIGKALLPTVNDLADRINKFVRSDEFNEWVQDLSKWLKDELPGAIDKAGDAIVWIKDHVKELGIAFGAFTGLRIASKFANIASALGGLAGRGTSVAGGTRISGGALGITAVGVAGLAALWANEQAEEARAQEQFRKTRDALLKSDNTMQDAIKTLGKLPESGKNLQDYVATIEGAGKAYKILHDRIDASMVSLESLNAPLDASQQGAIDNLMATGRWNDALKLLRRYIREARDELKPFSDKMVEAQGEIDDTGGKLDQLGRTVDNVSKKKVDIPVQTPGLVPTVNALKSLGGIVDGFVGAGVKINFSTQGDPTSLGSGSGSAGAIARAAIKAVAGPQAISSTYRSPWHNAAVGGSPTSLHMDRNNPANDIVGTNLQGVYNWIAANFGGNVRELIYGHSMIKHGVRLNYAPNDHWDHVHVADKGGRFKGPGYVAMGAGYETFAGGLQPAKKVGDAPSGNTFNVYVMGPALDEIADEVMAGVFGALRSAQIQGIHS